MERPLKDLQIDIEDFIKVLDFLPYPFMVTEHRDGRLYTLFTNKKFLEEIGYTPIEIPTINDWFRVAYPDETYRSEVMTDWYSRIALAEQTGYDSVIVQRNVCTKKNGQKWFEIKASLLGPIQFVAYVNINDEMTREEYLAKLNENKDRTLSILSHDLRSPLNSLYSMLELINKGLLTEQETKEAIKKLSSQVFRMREFVDTTLNWSKINFENMHIENQKIDVASTCTTIMSVYDSILNEKKISPELRIDKRMRLITDPEIFAILFRNVFSNAIKYTPASGVIKVRATRQKNGFRVTIENSGAAIRREKIEKILARNYSSEVGTAGEKGLGLGLKLCQELLDMIGGKIEIETPNPTLTVFNILIPSRKAPLHNNTSDRTTHTHATDHLPEKVVTANQAPA